MSQYQYQSQMVFILTMQLQHVILVKRFHHGKHSMGLLHILEKSGKTWKYCRNFQDLEKFSKLLLVWKSRKIPENNQWLYPCQGYNQCEEHLPCVYITYRFLRFDRFYRFFILYLEKSWKVWKTSQISVATLNRPTHLHLLSTALVKDVQIAFIHL